MSGIIGKLSFDADETLARSVLDRMLDATALTPNGVEGRGVYEAPGIGLGWCGTGDQRALGVTENHQVHVVADSRLVNAGELRTELEHAGHSFRRDGDEDVIAHAYEQWGTHGFERLRGPFACAVWDGAHRRLVLARDHVGLRPLHFALLPGHGLVFASNIRALFQDPGVAREWCPDGIDAYLALGYVPAPLTAYRRISKLEPARALVVEGRSFHVEEFWTLPSPERAATSKDVMWALTSALQVAVRRELSDDARARLLYSGGVASSALLTAAPADAGAPITVDLDHDPNELTRSDAAAAHLGRVRELETIARPVSALIDEVTATSGEPTGDPSALAEFAICQATAKRTNLAVSAHGASLLWTRATRARRLWDDRRRHALYTRWFAWQVRERAIDGNMRTLLTDQTIATAQHAAAAAGVDLRCPFLDRPLVELAASTPDALKHRGRTGGVLGHLLAPHLPARLRPTVRSASPSHPWLRPALAVLVPRMLFSPRFDGRGIFSRPALQQVWKEHVASRGDHSRRLWALVMLEFWFRAFIDGDAAAEPLEYAVLVKAA